MTNPLLTIKNRLIDLVSEYRGDYPWSRMLRLSTYIVGGSLCLFVASLFFHTGFHPWFWWLTVWGGMALWVDLVFLLGFGRPVLSHIGYHAGIAYYATWGILVSALFHLIGVIPYEFVLGVVVLNLSIIIIDQFRRLAGWVRGLFS